MNEKLPPLPEPKGKYPAYWDSFRQCWIYYEAYPAEQVEAIRREAVRLCARVARQCRSGFGAEAAISALLKENHDNTILPTEHQPES